MFIKTLNNKTCIVSITNIVKVIDIKKKLYDIEGIPVIQQQLFCGTKLLENSKNISEYNLCDMSNIEMRFQLLGGGKGACNNRGRHDVTTGKRELVQAIPGETVYAIVKTICGNKRVLVLRIDNGTTVGGRISGSIRAWVKKDDIVLIGLRDFQEDKVDVIWRYTPEEARKLVRAGYIPQNSVMDKSTDNDATCKVDFYDEIGLNKNHDDENEEKNMRRYDMPSSDESSDEDEDTITQNNGYSSKNKDDFPKNNDDINIDNI